MLDIILESRQKKFFTACDQLVGLIESKHEDIIELLTKYETHDAAQDEIDRSVRTLKGLPQEIENIDRKLLDGLNVATFFPLNLPLYSLVLFGVAPSLFAKHVFIRPPEVMDDVLHDLWELIEIDKLFPNLSLKVAPRHIFIDLYASDCDVIIFTGKYENALSIQKKCPGAMLIYNGSGINPFIVFDNADISLAVNKAVEMRCFNSGQDCAGPDAFFVHSSIAEEFTKRLEQALANVQVGATSDPRTDVGPTMKQAYITELQQWAHKHAPYLVYGGQIDAKNHLVHPSIYYRRLEQFNPDEGFHEFFAPFFNVIAFDSDEQLEQAILSEQFHDRSMYISVFGDNPAVEAKIDFARILKNKIVNDIEIGNTEYGGWGPKANFLVFGGRKIVQPILISRDIHSVLG